MPFRWSLLALLLLFLISLLTLSRIARASARGGLTSRGKTSSLLLHHLQEEEHLRSRSAQIRLDLEENDLQLEFDCTLPSSVTESSSPSLSREEKLLQEADFELELSLEIQRLIQRHQYDSTNLNESPSELQRHLERKLRNQKRRMSAYRASLRHQAALSYASQECVAWRAKQQQLETQQRDRYSSSFIHAKTQKPLSSANALERFKQFHPNRQDLDSDSIFADTLNALANKQYTDANGFVIELDPTKIMAGSRRASAYQNDDIHVLVLDMQWDPEVTVVVGNVLDETVKLRQEGYRPVMLNVGNSLIPGGDYHLDSATNNEADLFRRTTLYQCLDQEPRRSRFYPLQENGGVYCPNQAIFRHGQDRDNEFMDRFEWISVVSVAPIPELETREKDGGLGGVQFLEGEDDLLRRKILAAMKIGVSQGHDALVLPPHGTDAGQNPAEAIAAIYRSIIGRDFMGGRKRFQTYKKIVMVLDPEQADKIVNETSSYRPLLPVTTVTATPLPGQGQELSSDEPRPEDGSQEIQPLEKRFTNADEPDQESFISEDQEYDNEKKDKETVKNQDDNEAEDKDTFEASEQVSEDASQHSDETEETDFTEDGEFIEEEVGNNEELPAAQLVTEDEVSESEALLEEQDLEEDADISDEAMEEDLGDIPQILKVDSTPTKDDSSEHEKEEAEESSSVIVASPENEVNNDNAQEEQTEEQTEGQTEEQTEGQTEEEYVQITETVREVFERMLEQRSLLIVKNRARGLLGPEEPDNSKVSSNTTSNVNSTESIPSSSVVSAPVPTA
ncbi:hypothetical protein BGZ80_010309 [Entomortierella chlamydospora]|uniref:Microbial-type PARG catalytic domain-containing protein n=1 Tax=Entomortierella chlamydospora TaxID=101097 RepID=A0A9P6MV28_9FUNG|nr:hypothetical protein BGZ79_000551 [Entomortierella chlamydospora]KAG0014686.1 hypothetical protein BGZ80_010309 [Entomortierella chlamydospora]